MQGKIGFLPLEHYTRTPYLEIRKTYKVMHYPDSIKINTRYPGVFQKQQISVR